MKRAHPQSPTTALLKGRVVATFRRGYQVILEDGARIACISLGRKLDVACGDHVSVALDGGPQAVQHIGGDARGVIVSIAARASLLYRSDQFKQKTLAANVTQMVMVVAGEPPFHDQLLTRCMVAAEAAGIKVLIACNKSDLAQAHQVWQRLQAYRDMGYRCLALSARSDCAPLRTLLQNEASVLVGQSGMGKSTIINSLIPRANAATREISTALNSGKHTTTAAIWYALDQTSSIVDTPGLQAFGLAHLTPAAIVHAFPEFRPLAGSCRFTDCTHGSEPGCRLRHTVEAGGATEQRLDMLRVLVAENTARPHWRTPKN